MTGDASSAGRRALVVSVSHAGGEVKPMSLSAAIDISPELDAGEDDDEDSVDAVNADRVAHQHPVIHTKRCRKSLENNSPLP